MNKGEGGGLPDSGFEDQSPNTNRPRLRFKRSHEAPAEALPTHERRHVHPLEFGRVGVEQPEGATADRRPPSANDEEGAAAVAYFLGIQLKVVCSGLRIQLTEFGVQLGDKVTADLSVQLGASDGDQF